MAVKSVTKFPTRVVDLRDVGTPRWSGINNSLLDDSNSATRFGPFGGVGSEISDSLVYDNFNFALPRNATIRGISVETEASRGDTANASDETAILRSGGSDVGDNKATSGVYSIFPTFETRTYGGSTDLWNTSLTVNDINSSGFGFRFQVDITDTDAPAGPSRVVLNYVSITVYYEVLEDELEEFDQTQVDQSEKQFFAKIKSPSGDYITTLYQDDFDWMPNFSININDGASAMTAKLVHSFNDMKYPSTGQISEGNQTINTYKGIDRLYNGIKLGNIISFYITDKETINKKIYTGYIAGFRVEKSPQKEEIFIEILPNSARLEAILIKDDDYITTEVAYQSQDPADILRNIIDINAITTLYTDLTVYDTGVSRTYTFTSQTVMDGLRKIVELCPFGWFFYLGGDDLVYLKNYTNTEHISEHIIPLRNIENISISRSIFNLRNKVYFLGGDDPQLFKNYNKIGSERSFGTFEERLADERVTNESTAEIISERYLKYHSKPTAQIIFSVLDSNYSKKGIDIENLNVGDIVILQDEEFDNAETRWGSFNWGEAYWKYSLYEYRGVPAYIQSIRYGYHGAEIVCSFDLPPVTNRIEDINRDLTNFRFKDAPSSPS